MWMIEYKSRFVAQKVSRAHKMQLTSNFPLRKVEEVHCADGNSGGSN